MDKSFSQIRIKINIVITNTDAIVYMYCKRGLNFNSLLTHVGLASFISVRSKAAALLWFSVACFWCQSFGNVSFKCVHIISVRFGLLSGHLLGNSCSLG